MSRKGPWEGYSSRLPLRAHFHQKRDVWVRGSISAFYIVVFKESLFQAKEKENSPYGLKKNPETHFFTTVETDSPRMDDERYRVQTSSR